MLFLDSHKLWFIDFLPACLYYSEGNLHNPDFSSDDCEARELIGFLNFAIIRLISTYKRGIKMAVMDEFKEERQALRNASFKTKFNYFVDYYKWYVIGIVCVAALAASFIYQLATKKETAFNAVMLNASLMTEGTEYTQKFTDYAGIDLNTHEVYFDTSIRIVEDSTDETTYTSVQKLMVYTAAAELDVMVTDCDSFAKYANSYTFYDLRDILSEEQIKKYEPYFYYVDLETVEEIEVANDNLDEDFVPVYPDYTKPEEMSTPVPVGILLDSNEELQENYYFRGDGVVMGVYGNTTHLDTALQYIDFLMQD